MLGHTDLDQLARLAVQDARRKTTDSEIVNERHEKRKGKVARESARMIANPEV